MAAEVTTAKVGLVLIIVYLLPASQRNESLTLTHSWTLRILEQLLPHPPRHVAV
jgi:hypothetical protein